MFKSKNVGRLIALLLVMLMTVSLAACGGETNTTQTTGGTDQTTAAPTEKSKEPLKMDIAWNEAWANTDLVKEWPTDVAKEIFARTGITFRFMGMDNEKFKVLLAGGDLPEMLFVDDIGAYMEQLITGGQIIPLDELVQTNGPDLLKYCPERLDLSRKYKSQNTGKLYFIPSNAGTPAPPLVDDLGFVIRWDYYKEMGYPKFDKDVELIPYLVEIQKKHPTTDDGKKTYGVGFFTDWGLWCYTTSSGREGFNGFGSFVNYEVGTGKISNLLLDTDSPLWETINFLNQGNRHGLLDPDSFTMKMGDYASKMGKGQYIVGTSLFWAGFNGAQWKLDNNTDKGYVTIPVEGGATWKGGIYRGGGGKGYAITKNCENPDRAMDLINFFNSPDGVRLCTSGIKGKQWDVIDGKAQMMPEYLDSIDRQDPKNINVGNGQFWDNQIGLLGGVLCEDGQIADLRATPEVMKRLVKGVDADYCKYYGVDYPYQIIQKYVDEGKMRDQSKENFDIGITEIVPEEIKRIDLKMNDLSYEYIPKAILAKTDEEFAAVQQEYFTKLKAGGIETSAAWWTAAWQKAKDEAAAMQK